MKLGIILVAFLVSFLKIQQGLTLPAFHSSDTASSHGHEQKRDLTPEEAELASAARAHIAKVLERNLIRLFAAVTLEEQRNARQQRQQAPAAEDEAEDEESETATFNPNTLPQVAALLGAIFSGNLNLTNVVDRAFYLVPDAVRSQVTGLFKLLGGNGQPDTGSGSTNQPELAPAFVPHPLDTTTTESTKSVGDETLPTELDLTTTTARVTEPDGAAFGSVFESKATSGSGTKKPSSLDLDEQPVLPAAERVAYDDDDTGFTDEQLKRAEEEVVEYAKQYAPYVKDKQPRFFLGSLGQMFRSDSLNFTTIFRAVPDLFKGARQAFVLLETLGDIATGEDDK